MELSKENGEKLMDPEEIKNEIRSFFEDLYTKEEDVTQEEMEAMSAQIPYIIEDKDSDLLNLPVSEEDVRKAIWTLHPDKDPGPHGFTINLYRRF